MDDTTASEVVAKGNRSCAQEMAHKFAEWSTQNRVKLNLEISDVIKKASKRLYFLVRLKRSRVPWQDMSALYTACIRSRRGKLLEFGQNAWLFEILTDVITGRPLIFTVPDLWVVNLTIFVIVLKGGNIWPPRAWKWWKTGTNWVDHMLQVSMLNIFCSLISLLSTRRANLNSLCIFCKKLEVK